MKFKKFPKFRNLPNIFILLQNVTPHTTAFRQGSGILVILLSVTLSIPQPCNGFSIEFSSDSSSSEEKIRHPKNDRTPRQMSLLLAPALQTMGCLPKFFCGMNSKKPSDSTSTLNDLAYLIKFAMVDDDLDDSVEDNNKHPKHSLHSSSSSEIEDQKFSQLADEKLILDNPDHLNFIWKDMKKKIKDKFDESLEEEGNINQMMDDMEQRVPRPGLFSLLRFGRSVDGGRRRRQPKRTFWETPEFDTQMTLAARIGQASADTTNSQCTSTFNLCPYTLQQMKDMVGGQEEETKTTTPKTKWVENTHRHPISTTPNPISHAIYLLNKGSLDGQRPGGIGNSEIVQKVPMIQKEKTILTKLTELDDEEGFDQQHVNYASDIRVIKRPPESISSSSTSSEELPPKLKSTPKVKVTQLIKKPLKKTKPHSTSSEKVSKKPHKHRIKIGLPRPKYTIKHKYRHRPVSAEIEDKKAAMIAASDEKSEEASGELKQGKSSEESNQQSSEEKPEVKLAQKLRLNSKRPQKYKVKNKPKQDVSEESDEEQEKKNLEIIKSLEEESNSEEANTDKSTESDSPELHPIKYSFFKPTESNPPPRTQLNHHKKNNPHSDQQESGETPAIEASTEDSSEEDKPTPPPTTTTTPAPPSITSPYPTGLLDSLDSDTPTPKPTSSNIKPSPNRPVITDPNNATTNSLPSKFPTLPRFKPPPSRRPTTTTTTTASSRKDGEDYAVSKEQDENSDESAQDKTQESKESSEELDPNHVKNIFSKASIASLGEGEEKVVVIPPPPPVANFNSPAVVGEGGGAPPPVVPEKVTTAQKDEEDEDDVEEIIGQHSKEQLDQSSEEEEEEQTQDKKQDSSEEDKKEKDTPQIGDAVVVIDNKPIDLLPLPPLAQVSTSSSATEVKVPASEMAAYLKPKKKVKPISNKLQPETKTSPNAVSPASNPASSGVPSAPSSPGGLPRNPAAGNMQGGNRRNPGNSGNNGNTATDGTDSSEEEVGKSSEEEHVSSEEEEEENSAKTLLKSNKTTTTTTAKPSITKKKSEPYSYPPLPPIYRREPQPTPAPTLMSILLKNKPTNRIRPPQPTKDTFYTKPLSPKMVKYLRETYGGGYSLPRRITTRMTTTTTARPIKKSSVKKNNFKIIPNLSSDVIHFDDEFEIGESSLSRRTGLSASSKRRKKPVKPPPVFGRVTFHG